MTIQKSINIDNETQLSADEHKIQNIMFDTKSGKIRVFVESFKTGATKPIKEAWYELTIQEFEDAVATTEHTEFVNTAKSKAYVALDTKVFNPPEPEPVVEEEEPI